MWDESGFSWAQDVTLKLRSFKSGAFSESDEPGCRWDLTTMHILYSKSRAAPLGATGSQTLSSQDLELYCRLHYTLATCHCMNLKLK